MNYKLLTGLFLLACVLIYLSLSPGTIVGMGYSGENVVAADQILTNVGDWLTLHRASTAVVWPRHGFLEAVFQIPFVLIGRLVFGSSPQWTDRIVSIQPVVATALICTILFVWVYRETSSLLWSYLLSSVAGFGTLLWPYAYIGMEPIRSLALLLAGYLAIGSTRSRGWFRAMALALSCAVAFSVKANGLFLLPALVYLFATYFLWQLRHGRSAWRARAQLVVALFVIVAIHFCAAYTRSLSPTWAGAAASRFSVSAADGPMAVAFNALNLFVSPNKGLFLYAPAILLCILALTKAYRARPPVAIFAVLSLGGLVAGCSLVYYWADETWGPRYLHASIAPLFVCFAVARKSAPFRFRKEVPLVATAVLGSAISFLGAFYYYGSVHGAATYTSHATIEQLLYNPDWNHIRFNWKLLQEWIRFERGSKTPSEQWPPPQHRWYPAPGESIFFPSAKTVALRDMAFPQAALFRSHGLLRGVYLGAFLAGFAVFLWLGRIVARSNSSQFMAAASKCPEAVSAPDTPAGGGSAEIENPDVP